jgi:hypothetical protein
MAIAAPVVPLAIVFYLFNGHTSPVDGALAYYPPAWAYQVLGPIAEALAQPAGSVVPEFYPNFGEKHPELAWIDEWSWWFAVAILNVGLWTGGVLALSRVSRRRQATSAGEPITAPDASRR